jgi:MFS family permease
VHIPQPEKKEETSSNKLSVLSDIAFGWHYLTARRGLLYLLLYFASVNFFMNLSFIMVGPLVLSFGSPTSMGVAQSVLGAGMLVGSLVMSVWGGFKQGKIRSIIGFISLASLGFLVMGFQPGLTYVGVGILILAFFLPFGSGPSAAIFAEKVAPEVQGRVFATRSMITQSMMPLAFVLSGILADKVFNPLLVEGGALVETFIGRMIGVGPGRGIGLMLMCSGIFLLVISGLAYANPRVRKIETEIPDVLPEAKAADKQADGDKRQMPIRVSEGG